MYKRLEQLYYCPDQNSRFRHFYSDIFSVLTQINRDSSLGSIDVLGQNLGLIRNGYQSLNTDENGNPIDISNSLRKLYDHVSLDIARITYSEAQDREAVGTEIQEQVSATQTQVEELQQSIKQAETAQKEIEANHKDLESEIRSSQKEYIAILGIFAAVVLSFTGGITFSTAVFNNIHKVSIYRISFVTLLIGYILVNVLFGLFYYIHRLVKGPNEKNLKPILIINVIFVLLLGVLVFAWKSGFVEKRNINLREPIAQQTDTINGSEELPFFYVSE